jgi:hypothetical protein
MNSLRAWTLLSMLSTAAGCSGDCPATNVDLSVCDLAAGPFSLEIDNPYYPLPVGRRLILEGGGLRLEVTVLDETEVVAGVTTRVVEERETEGGRVVEVSRNFFAQAPDGTVCYFGEEVSTGEGEWRAGEGQNRPGIIMPADPAAGLIFQQEVAPGIAEDQDEIIGVGVSVTTPAGTFNDAHEHRDCNPLEGAASDTKFYVAGIGLVVDAEVRLVRQEGP